jgi:hypothetical protein
MNCLDQTGGWPKSQSEGGNMKSYIQAAGLIAPALFLAGYLFHPAAIKAAEPGDPPEVTKLLADAKAEAAQLKGDAEDLDKFAKSRLSWQSHATKIDMIKEHINASGKLLAKMKDLEPVAAPWQQTAIRRIEPLLKELADNTETAIRYMNENQNRIHFQEFQDYVKANYEIALDLDSLIRDFVDYGEAKEKMERLGKKLEITG